MAEWDNFTNQKQREKYLRNLVRTNEKALLKSIMLIYNNQTFEEKEPTSIEDALEDLMKTKEINKDTNEDNFENHD